MALHDWTAPVRNRTRLITRRPTASRRLLPDFLIIGAAKSGTTSLRGAFGQHPAITLSFTPEVHYFDWNFHRGTEWYRAHFPTRRTRERSLHQRGEFATGEKSPYYLFDPSVPTRVRALVPQVKLIILLRDPVARALSHYHESTRNGWETLSFEDALASELRQREPSRHPSQLRSLTPESSWRSYIARGRYAEQLERWLHLFNREQIHVTLSERFFADPGGVVRNLHEFLGLTPVMPPDLAPQNGAVYDPMSPALRSQLQDLFADDVSRLAGLIGERPGWW